MAKLKNYNLIVLTRKWNRNLAAPEPAQWECVNKETFEIRNKSEQGAKRAATLVLLNTIKVPTGCNCFRDTLWWSRWKPLEYLPKSDWHSPDDETKFYRTTSIFSKYHIRAELIEEI